MAMQGMRPLLLAALFASAAGYSLGFRLPAVASPPSRFAALLMEAEPPLEPEVPEPEPAPAPEEAAPVEAPPPTEAAAEPDMDFDEGSMAKEALKSEVGDGLLGTRPDAAVVGEILLALEAGNPTRSPATSPLLNGKWKVLYASGTSPGLKALQLLLKGAQNAPKSPSGAEIVDVQDAYITIQAEQPRAEIVDVQDAYITIQAEQ